MINTIMEIGKIGNKIIDKILPDEKSKLEAKAKLIKLQQDGELQELAVRYNAIIAEAKSSDVVCS